MKIFQQLNKILLFCFIAIFGVVFPKIMFADYGYLTMPVDPANLSYFGSNTGINAWVDHTTPQSSGGDQNTSTFTKYTGVAYTTSSWISVLTCSNTSTGSGVACYNGHEGIDYAVATGTPVFAAASGTVQQSQWQDPNDTTNTMNFGRFVRIWHSQYGISTLYAHLDSTSSLPGDTVTRATIIGKSGNTGCVLPCAHLHFQVYNADVTVTSSPPIDNFFFADGVDPYGWSGPGGQASDTWTNDVPFGYMWADPLPHTTSSFVHYVTSSFLMTASTTWKADQIYIIQTSLTVSSSATLTVKQGAIVKFTANASLVVNGKLDVQGTSTDPVYFTSIKDDAIGGDMNDDATTTTPAAGDWAYIYLEGKSTSTIKNAVIRYGGASNNPFFADVYVNGGYLSATSTVFASSSNYGLEIASGTVKITTSTFVGNSYGVVGQGAGSLTITTSTLTNNANYAGSFILTDGLVLSSSGNTATGNGTNGFLVSGNTGSSQTWGKDIPYVNSALTVSSGKTLTLNPGMIMKSGRFSQLYISGTLNAQGSGTSTNMVYFTSLTDDSIGGDTNGDGTSTSPLAGDWGGIEPDAGSSSTISRAMVRYGGIQNTYSDIYMTGGKLKSLHLTVASSANYGVRVSSGTLSIASSTITTHPQFGVYNPTNMTSSAAATQNWWGSSLGPYNPSSNPGGATSSPVSDYVTYNPWLTSAP